MPRADPVITLTTDFGQVSPYLAAMKGVILGIQPAARLVELSATIPPQDVRHAAFFLAAAVPYFPPETLHVVVVDPGVGGNRAILYVEMAGHRLLVPDNGCWTWLGAPDASPSKVIAVREPRYRRETISATFHGRDIFAPVAGHLACGLNPVKLGPPVDTWVRLERPRPRPLAKGWQGEVLFVDHFGNLISNIPADSTWLAPAILRVGKRAVRRFRWVRSYAEAKAGQTVALISSNGNLEVAVVQGNAARRLRARVGTPLAVEWPG